MARIVPGAKCNCFATRTSCCLPSVTTAKFGRYPSWSNNKCSLTAPFERRNWAQSNTNTHREITLASKLISLFLKRNFRFFFPGGTGHHLLTFCQELLEHCLVELPGSMFVGVG